MYDAIVVGGGLFGQVIARALRNEGQDVVVFDRPHPEAGSAPAACLMKPSWFSSMGREVYEPALAQLASQYEIQDIEFEVGAKFIKTKVHWIDPQHILCGDWTIRAEVVKVRPGVVWVKNEGAREMVGDIRRVEARTVVVAAGVWTERLLPQYPQIAQKGVAFLWRGWHPEGFQPFIKPWAPYRQLVAFDRGDGLWSSDGTAIKAANWTNSHEFRAWERVQDALPIEEPICKVLLGLRPYARGHKPCLLEEVEPGLWVASGGAKNGTMAAGYCAHVIRERTS